MCSCCGCCPATPPSNPRTLNPLPAGGGKPLSSPVERSSSSIPPSGAALVAGKGQPISGPGGMAVLSYNMMDLAAENAAAVAAQTLAKSAKSSDAPPPPLLSGVRRLTLVGHRGGDFFDALAAGAANPATVQRRLSPSGQQIALAKAAAYAVSGAVGGPGSVLIETGGQARKKEASGYSAAVNGSQARPRRLTAPALTGFHVASGLVNDKRALNSDRSSYQRTLQVPSTAIRPAPHSTSSLLSGGSDFSFTSNGSSLNGTPKGDPAVLQVNTEALSATNSLGEVTGIGTPSNEEHPAAAAAAGSPKPPKPTKTKKNSPADLDQLDIEPDYYKVSAVEVTATTLASNITYHTNEDGGPPIPFITEGHASFPGSPKHFNRGSPTALPVNGSIVGIPSSPLDSISKPVQAFTASGAAGGAAPTSGPTG
jgi:hypothetical protein